MVKKKIIIAGFGNLGKRYLEGILNSKNSYEILIYDINLKQTKNYLDNEIDIYQYKNKLIKLINLKDIVYQKIDLLIVSTTSDVRYQVLNKLIKFYQIKNVILEKVLFQKNIEYKKVLVLTKEMNIFINQGYRNDFLIKEIAKNINQKKTIKLTVSGKNWGLACNAIHFFDFYMYLRKVYDININKTQLSKKFNSKRKDFIEFFGEINSTHDKDIINIKCDLDKKIKDKYQVIKVENDNNVYIIDTFKNSFSFYKGKKLIKKEKFKFGHLSKYSTKLIDNIVDEKEVNIPKFGDYYEFSINYIELFRKHLIKKYPNSKWLSVPIT
tara:strand:+ start:225 stop:1199 length:975 start_codon:yes stop_codon:yes gene_type:complete